MQLTKVQCYIRCICAWFVWYTRILINVPISIYLQNHLPNKVIGQNQRPSGMALLITANQPNAGSRRDEHHNRRDEHHTRRDEPQMHAAFCLHLRCWFMRFVDSFCRSKIKYQQRYKNNKLKPKLSMPNIVFHPGEIQHRRDAKTLLRVSDVFADEPIGGYEPRPNAR